MNGYQTLIGVILGGGGATFVWTIVRSYLALRDNAEGREDKAVARLAAWEENCREQLLAEREWGMFWQRRAGQFQYLLVTHGIEVPPPIESPPLPLIVRDEEDGPRA